MNAFFGSKERVRIPLSGKHCSLQAFVKHVVEHAGLREEAQKRGLGSRIDIKLCRLEKGPDGNALISGHPGGLTPGNPREFAPIHLQIPPTQGQYSSTTSYHCPFPRGA